MPGLLRKEPERLPLRGPALTVFSNSFFDLLILCVCVCAWQYIHRPPCAEAYGGQERALDPLRLELHLTINHHVDAGN